jgi:RNA polymerase sigma-70 factor (ECF subfamily)
VHLEETSLPGPLAAGNMASADARLVEQIRRGDAEAGRRFVRLYYPGVYRYLLARTGRPETAADLTQETFVQAWRSLDTFDDRMPLRPWLLRIAHRELLQALRSQRPATHDFAGGTQSLEAIAELPDPGAAGWTEAVELREVLRALPAEERELVVLHYLEGYRCEEIAQILGIPLGRVRHRLVDARARLRRELGEEGTERRP